MSLKTQNLPLITLYLLFNLAVFIVVYLTSSFEFDGFIAMYESLSKKDGIVFVLLPLIIFIVLGIVSQKWKEIIVFWKKNNRLPGCFAFSKYAKDDDRINTNLLKSKYGKLPRKPSDQNSLWYGIYKNMQDKGIDKTHKDFLLARELTVVTVLFFFTTVPVLFFLTNIRIDNLSNLIYYSLFLVVEYLIIRFVAKNHAERLVVNVLASECSKIHKEKHVN